MITAMFGSPGPWELLLVFLVILLLFGARKLPDLAKSLGKSLGEFKKGREESDRPEVTGTSANSEQPAATEEKDRAPEE
ncbi:MAG: twin-arginine translocase TatA/TatE family subunit [Lentisphaerales bacterium]|jgi:sec-independent protein translocase protein TatA|nr:MAG: twin-arginine translocase TatA/TatE family subunit [Lentisphaerales bacterium]